MYFSKIPNIYYDYDINGARELKIVKDITHNVRIRRQIFQNITLYDEYDMMDGETPEIVSAKIYGSSAYHWVIMIMNDRYDYINDFPLTSPQLINHVRQTYGDDNIYGIHHYEDSAGFVVNPGGINVLPVTNYDHEVSVNEKKRRIKLVTATVLGDLIRQYGAML